MSLEINVVASSAVVFAAEEVIEADLVQFQPDMAYMQYTNQDFLIIKLLGNALTYISIKTFAGIYFLTLKSELRMHLLW